MCLGGSARINCLPQEQKRSELISIISWNASKIIISNLSFLLAPREMVDWPVSTLHTCIISWDLFLLPYQVPELAGFWILTLVLQLPLTLMLLLNESMLIMPMERAVNIIMALFVLFETVQGYRVIKSMIEQQVSKFHVQQFDDLTELQEMQEDGVEEVGFRPHWGNEVSFERKAKMVVSKS